MISDTEMNNQARIPSNMGVSSSTAHEPSVQQPPVSSSQAQAAAMTKNIPKRPTHSAGSSQSTGGSAVKEMSCKNLQKESTRAAFGKGKASDSTHASIGRAANKQIVRDLSSSMAKTKRSSRHRGNNPISVTTSTASTTATSVRTISEKTAAPPEAVKLLQKMREPHPGESLDSLHNQNINTPKEIIDGYKSVMTTKQLFAAMGETFSEAKTLEEKSALLNLASKWINSPLHEEDLKNKEIKQSLKNFINLYTPKNLGNYNAEIQEKLYKINKDLFKQPGADFSQPSVGQGKEVNSFSELSQLNNPKAIFNELRALSAQLQAEMTIDTLLTREDDAKNNKENKAQKAGDVLSSTMNLITLDILNSTSKKEASEKYKLYLKAGKEAMNSNDAATLNIIVSGLGTVLDGLRPELSANKKNLLNRAADYVGLSHRATDYSRLFETLNAAADLNNNFAKPREMLKASIKSPALIPVLFKDLINAKEGNEKRTQTGEFNANLIQISGEQFVNFRERQKGMEDGRDSQLKLAAFFENSINKPEFSAAHLSNLTYTRRSEIKKYGWSGAAEA